MFVFCEQHICRTLMPVQDAQAAPGVSTRDNPGEEDDGAGSRRRHRCLLLPRRLQDPAARQIFHQRADTEAPRRRLVAGGDAVVKAAQ